jgi:hypothetical protein
VIHRLFLERNGDVPAQLGLYRNFLGFAVGAIVPCVLVVYHRGTEARVPASLGAPGVDLRHWALVPARALVIGACAAGLPLALTAGWGAESLPGVILGGVAGVSAAVMIVLSAREQARAARGAAPLLLGVALSAVYVPIRYGELGELTRSERVWAVAVGGAVLALWFVVDGILAGRPRAAGPRPEEVS